MSEYKMRGEENETPAVTYEAVEGKEKEAEAGLDRAFDLLFEEVLKEKKRKAAAMIGTKFKGSVDS